MLLMSTTIFKKIIDRQIPAQIIYENEFCIAFHDVNPQAPVHALVIPKQEIVNLASLADDQVELAGRLLLTVRDVARQLGLKNGYRVVANCGRDGGQTVDHLHFHILGGRPMAWPPG
jgi:histidine triad (HIT) family protein